MKWSKAMALEALDGRISAGKEALKGKKIEGFTDWVRGRLGAFKEAKRIVKKIRET